MKKYNYITIATLFVAGTMTVNAAINKYAQWDSFIFDESGKILTTLSNTDSELFIEKKTSSTSSTSDGKLNVVGGNALDAKTIVDLSQLSLSDFTLAITLENFTNTNGTLVAMFSGGTSSDVGKGIGTGRESGNHSGYIVNVGSWNKNGDVKPIDGGNVTLALTYNRSSNTMSLYAGATGGELALSNTATVSSLTANYLTLGSFATANANGLGTFTVSQMAIYNTVLDTDQITSGKIFVPEPSAFGLLAGLGALALVGARRRRK